MWVARADEIGDIPGEITHTVADWRLRLATSGISKSAEHLHLELEAT
jgi:hypothetical protein